MQERHVDRKRYFRELAQTSSRYYIPYLSRFYPEKMIQNEEPAGKTEYVLRDFSVLEIGCGEGGNLLPFAQAGASVCGVDLAENKILHAREYFEEAALKCNENSTLTYEFISSDIFQIEDFKKKFDLILVHDVIEHIHDKKQFLQNCRSFLSEQGRMFVAFPPWQMPFGGHHQMASSKLISHLPYIHLMHRPFYKLLLKISGESSQVIDDLMEIKDTGISSGRCRRLIEKSGYEIVDRRMYLINPHYEAKFGMKPRKTLKLITKVPYLRDLLSTSCWMLIQVKKNG